MIDPFQLLVTVTGIFVIAFMRGAFGGGLAVIGIPILSLGMDPVSAGAILAPLFVLMDAFAMRHWRESDWSRREARVLIPALIVGIGVGTALIGWLDPRWLAVGVGTLTLVFAAQWFFGRGMIEARPRSTPRAVAAGVASGVTTMVAHAGAPPVSAYLLSLRMPKGTYVGTMGVVFTASNVVKTLPWLWVADLGRAQWLLILAAAPVVPVAVWLGWFLHNRLDERQVYNACYALLVLGGTKLLWDGLAGG